MKFIWILVMPFLVSCASAVSVDYDSKTDFSQFTTYNFYPSIDSGLNELDEKRIKIAVDSLMKGKGFRKDEEPQFLINFYATERITSSRSTLGIGLGGGSRTVGVGVSGGIPIGGNEIEQRLTLDLIDVKYDRLIWQGVLDGRFKEKSSPDQKEIYYFSAMRKILNKFPPPAK